LRLWIGLVRVKVRLWLGIGFNVGLPLEIGGIASYLGSLLPVMYTGRLVKQLNSTHVNAD